MNKKKDKTTRPFVITGNWKMHKTISETKNFIDVLGPELKKNQNTVALTVSLAVPYTSLFVAAQTVQDNQYPILIGGQNMHEIVQGAFTGEISCPMLKDAGAQFVLIGHSERRHVFQESDERIHLKVQRAIEEKLHVVLCVGEQLKDREAGKTSEIIRNQIHSALKGISNLDQISLAYEPVWAIGTGKVAKPDDAQCVHAFCRAEIEALFGKAAASKIVIQYGGSVQPENAKELAEEQDIDGLLIGGASLKVETFLQIIRLLC